MSTEVVIVKELISNLKQTLNDRLAVFEDFLVKSKQSVASADLSGIETQLARLESRIHSVDEYAMDQVRTLAFNHDMLEKRVQTLEEKVNTHLHDVIRLIETIEKMQKRMDDEKPVEAAEVEAEIEQTQEAALSEQPVEEEVEADDEAEAEEEEQEEAEEEEEGDEDRYEHIFTYQKQDYFLDTLTNNVYIADKDGAIDPEDVKGIWNATTEKMWLPEKGKWWDYKTNKYTDPKTKK